MVRRTTGRDGRGARGGAPLARVRLGLAVGALGAVVAPASEAVADGCPSGMANVLGRFCIDRWEATVEVVDGREGAAQPQSPYRAPVPGATLRARSRSDVVPQAYISQVDAAAACAAAGKRLCTDAEWVTACKGRTPTRYPYGDRHEAGRCNDAGVSPLRALHGRDDSESTFGFEAMNDPRLNRVPGSLARTGAFSRCRNAFGVYDMVGNLHEWTAASDGTFRGGYYLDTSRNGEGCDYQTTAHSVHYHDYSIGFRCCRSLRGGAEAVARAPRPSAESGPPIALGPGERRHEVVAGDTLGAIAARHRVTVAALCERNELERTAPLRVGRQLVIPRPASAPAGSSVAAGTGAAGARVHVVQPGETLGGIARRYRVTVAALCAANGIDRASPIRPGQELRVPPSAAPPPAADTGVIPDAVRP